MLSLLISHIVIITSFLQAGLVIKRKVNQINIHYDISDTEGSGNKGIHVI